MFIKFDTKILATEWIARNDLLVGYDGEGSTRTLAEPKEGVEGWFIGLSPERWTEGVLAEPLELLDGVIVEDFERISEVDYEQ